MKSVVSVVCCVAVVAACVAGAAFAETHTLETYTLETYVLPVLPAEHKTVTDPESGASLLYLTSGPSRDVNLYFHDHSWLRDGSMILFTSDRKVGETFNGGLMGYLTATGELVAFDTGDKDISGVTAAAVAGNKLYGYRGLDIVELTVDIEASDAPSERPSRVTATSRVVCTLPELEGPCSIAVNCSDEWLAMGAKKFSEADGKASVILINNKSGEYRVLTTVSDPPGYAHHVQWSADNPNLMSYACLKPRLWVIDIRDGKPYNPYPEWDGELVTHEHWWTKDRLVFCGGTHEPPTEDSHLKVLDVHTGEVRIMGAGSWWPEGNDEQIAKRNLWHSSGSPDGRWVVADSWHGDMTLFEGKTTRPRVLTTEHRTYGKGDHPHVGWDREGKAVIFASHKLGSPDVCVATIPDAWQAANPTEPDRAKP